MYIFKRLEGELKNSISSIFLSLNGLSEHGSSWLFFYSCGCRNNSLSKHLFSRFGSSIKYWSLIDIYNSCHVAFFSGEPQNHEEVARREEWRKVMNEEILRKIIHES